MGHNKKVLGSAELEWYTREERRLLLRPMCYRKASSNPPVCTHSRGADKSTSTPPRSPGELRTVAFSHKLRESAHDNKTDREQRSLDQSFSLYSFDKNWSLDSFGA